MTLTIGEASVDEADVADLVAFHHADMIALSARESMHALDTDALRDPGITLWAAREDGDLVGIAALRRFGDGDAELKSMRVADPYRRTGAGRTLLRHLVDVARTTGIRALWLETGSDDGWLAARTLYASEGFVECDPFPGYAPDPNSTFMTRPL